MDITEQEAEDIELKKAFEELETAEKRTLYLSKMDSQPILPGPVVTSAVDTAEGIPTGTGISVSVNSNQTDANKIVRTYQEYIDEKIQKLNQADPTYKKNKETLDSWKKNAEPQVHKFEKLKDFQDSEFYKSMSKNAQASYSKDTFPKNITVIKLTFHSWEEAVNYLKNNEGLETAQEFVKTAQEKGFKIDSKVLENLTSLEEKPLEKSQKESHEEPPLSPRPGRR